MLERVIAEWGGHDDLWLFGYGSLIWRPEFEFAERRPARVHGWHRALKMWSRVNRGTVANPGLVFGLLSGGSCHGMVFRIPADASAGNARPAVAARNARPASTTRAGCMRDAGRPGRARWLSRCRGAAPISPAHSTTHATAPSSPAPSAATAVRSTTRARRCWNCSATRFTTPRWRGWCGWHRKTRPWLTPAPCRRDARARRLGGPRSDPPGAQAMNSPPPDLAPAGRPASLHCWPAARAAARLGSPSRTRRRR